MMNTTDIVMVALKAIEELGLSNTQQDFTDGVLTMALRLQASEYDAQLAKMDTESNTLIVAARKELAAVHAINVSWQGMNSDMHAALAVARNERDELKAQLAASEAERIRINAERVRDMELGMVGEPASESAVPLIKWDGSVLTVNDAVMNARSETRKVKEELDAAIKERDALRYELAQLGRNLYPASAPSLGQINYGPQPGHVEA